MPILTLPTNLLSAQSTITSAPKDQKIKGARVEVVATGPTGPAGIAGPTAHTGATDSAGVSAGAKVRAARTVRNVRVASQDAGNVNN